MLELKYHMLWAEFYSMTDQLLDGLKLAWRHYVNIETLNQNFTDEERARYSGLAMLIVRCLFRYKTVSVDGQKSIRWRISFFKKNPVMFVPILMKVLEADITGHSFCDCERTVKKQKGIDIWRCNAKQALNALEKV